MSDTCLRLEEDPRPTSGRQTRRQFTPPRLCCTRAHMACLWKGSAHAAPKGQRIDTPLTRVDRRACTSAARSFSGFTVSKDATGPGTTPKPSGAPEAPLAVDVPSPGKGYRGTRHGRERQRVVENCILRQRTAGAVDTSHAATHTHTTPPHMHPHPPHPYTTRTRTHPHTHTQTHTHTHHRCES